MAKKKEIVIKAKVLYDGKTKYENKTIVIEGNKIIEVSSEKAKADYEGFVTPAFIDAHSHIGMDREGEPTQEAEVNDYTNQIRPLNNPLNSIYFDDRAFKDAVDFGVLYSCVIPGSGNLIGGRAMIIRNYAKNRDEAFVKDYGFKMALGFNPRSTTEWKGERSNTRMGVYALLEKKFDDLLIKKEKASLSREKKLIELNQKKKDKKLTKKEFEAERRIIEKEFELEFNSEEKAILELLSGKKTAKVHVHKDDDVLYLIKLVKKYNLNVTADHTGDVFNKEIFDELAKNKIPIVYGPLGSVGYKVELKHAYYQNAGLLMKSKAFYGLMTDHPVIQTIALRDSLKFFMIQGMSEEDAISLITYKNAKILGIDDVLGTIEKGKLASIIVWDKNPLHLGAFPILVLGEGKVLRKKK
ncbi:MAG: amidohydrolase family protein [Candidatus Cloacimonadota bacterium]|nr:amidohydrolase family protein [Candidatus Cloacimonadota bacterium]